MKITFKKALSSIVAFRELQELKFPPSFSLQVYKLGKELDKELEAYKDLSKGIYKQHNVQETPEGYNLKDLAPEKFEKLSDDLNELLDQEVEIRDYKIPFETFERYELPISTNLLIALDWLINPEGLTDEEPPKEETVGTE